VIRIADEVREASAVVALETTLVAHGFPPGEGVEVALESERQVRAAGAASISSDCAMAAPATPCIILLRDIRTSVIPNSLHPNAEAVGLKNCPIQDDPETGMDSSTR